MTGTVKNDGGLIYPQIEYGEFWQNNGAKFLGIFLKALRQKLNSPDSLFCKHQIN